MPKKPKPKIEEVTKLFGVAHAEEADAKARKEKYRKQFFDLIEIPESQLSRQSIWYEGDDPDGYVAAMYPKWRILKKDDSAGEWKIIIQEDPAKKNFTYVNPLDGLVYARTVAESAPDIDLERLSVDRNKDWWEMTVQPKPPRELKPIDELTEEQKEILKEYLLPPKLTNRMEKPRKPKPEELDG